MMSNKVLFITDTFKDLNIKKDTSILMIEEAINNDFDVFQCEINDLFIEEGYVIQVLEISYLQAQLR